MLTLQLIPKNIPHSDLVILLADRPPFFQPFSFYAAFSYMIQSRLEVRAG